jgi:hypothetical protein
MPYQVKLSKRIQIQLCQRQMFIHQKVQTSQSLVSSEQTLCAQSKMPQQYDQKKGSLCLSPQYQMASGTASLYSTKKYQVSFRNHGYYLGNLHIKMSPTKYSLGQTTQALCLR